MFCPSCGKKLSDKARFCDGCGAKMADFNPDDVSQDSGLKTSCPYCGTPIGFDDVKCPGCRRELQRKSSESIKKLFEDVNKVDDEQKKIDLIKTFPIPTTREDIVEFMLLASSNFDAKYYVSHKDVENVSSAWLTKIDLCYKKGLMVFDDPRDINTIQKLYDDVHSQIDATSKAKLRLLIIGIILTVIGGAGIIIAAVVEAVAPAKYPLFLSSSVILIIGIILIVLSRKKKMTKKEMLEEKQEKERRRKK